MPRTLVKLLKGALIAGVLALSLVAAPAVAQIRIELTPPSVFVATTSPVYHDGHASYFYRGRWYYRDGRVWRYYHDEPTRLREHRMRHVPVRRDYGRHNRGRKHHKR